MISVNHLQQTLQRIEEIQRRLEGDVPAPAQSFQAVLSATTPTRTPVSPASPVANNYEPLITRAAAEYQLPPALLRAVIHAESNFRADAVSPKGAMGLMQLMPGTASGLGVSDPFDPVQNIEGGARYLRQLLDRFGGDQRLALAAYNAGPGAVLRYQGVPPFPETRQYVDRVMAQVAANGE